MKRFEFSLNNVLSMREFHEKEAEVALSRAVGERDIVKIAIEDLDLKIKEASYLFSKDLDINILFSTENYVRGLKIKKLQLQEKLIKLEKNVQVCIDHYINSSKDRKLLEKLKEKKLGEWKKMVKKEEIIAIGEIISAKTIIQP